MIQIVAIVLIWSYVLAFLYLTFRTARRSGESVWLFSAGRERQGIPAALFRIAFVSGCVLPLVSIWVDWEWAGGSITPLNLGTPAASIGIMVMIVGGAGALYSQWYMGNSWRIGAAEGRLGSIVSEGPFAYSRNPVFVGQITLFAGLVLAHATGLQLAILICVVVAAWMQVRIEERVLDHDLGKPYFDYRQRVRRWL
ncbi:isoprenylcysteine carboxylmethyltransferase family protein [Agrobacterium sp. lyk4-40-TYG-31]|uniref:methyltransferase family protein n=1 Tax=Agrobacterium sp. lyk4-40-TYG-31 TaxID=3040276 RepID=UPI00254DC780|nr:isoprenylcysteine carboxylmethyltransferase family protein [Agrobacterium sp. lyk4-40-TYG-31]